MGKLRGSRALSEATLLVSADGHVLAAKSSSSGCPNIFSISSQCVLETMHTAQTPASVLSARPCLQPHWGLDYSAGVEDVSKQHGGPLGLSFPFK